MRIRSRKGPSQTVSTIFEFFEAVKLTFYQFKLQLYLNLWNSSMSRDSYEK